MNLTDVVIYLANWDKWEITPGSADRPHEQLRLEMPQGRCDGLVVLLCLCDFVLLSGVPSYLLNILSYVSKYRNDVNRVI